MSDTPLISKASMRSKALFIISLLVFSGSSLLLMNTGLTLYNDVPSTSTPIEKRSTPIQMTTNQKRVLFLSGKPKSGAVGSDREKIVPPLASSEEEALYENPLESFETEKCKAIKEWQLQSFPACNPMHELDLTQILGQRLPGSGGKQAQVWRYRDDVIDVTTALRTMSYELHDYRMEKMAEWRIDNLVLERLTSSPNVMDIYGYCAASGLYEFSDHPSLGKQIRHQRLHTEEGYPAGIDTTQLMRAAVDAAKGLADLHSFDGDVATAGHGDIAYHQFIYLNGVYKIIDFNDGFLQRWDPETKKICNTTKTTALHGSVSPEEFQYGVRTEKSDVFSFGTVLYSILTGYRSFQDEKDREKIGNWLIKGKRSHIPDEYRNSGDPVHEALIKAMEKCWEGNPEDRPSAREIANDLSEALEKIEKERNSFDGKRWLGKSYNMTD